MLAINNDQEYEAQGYSLKTFRNIWIHPYNGEFLRMNLIEQDIEGELYCVPYQDEGFFFLSFLDQTGKEVENLDILKILDINQESLPISDFYEPMITVTFTPG